MLDGGILCICEQIAPYEVNGDNWTRRTIASYVQALELSGFVCEKDDIVRIDFKVHRLLFERKIAKLFYKRISRIGCNKNKLFLFLSRIFTKLSFKRVYTNWDGWGYCFIAARKKIERLITSLASELERNNFQLIDFYEYNNLGI